MVCRASALGDRHAPRWDQLQRPRMQEWVHPPPHGTHPHHRHPGEDPGILPSCSALLQSAALLTGPTHSPVSETAPQPLLWAGILPCAWGCPHHSSSYRSSLPWESLVVPPKISSCCQRMNFLEKPWQPPESSAGMSGLCGWRGGVRVVGQAGEQ